MPAGHVDSSITRIIPHDLNRRYPVVVRGDGVWVEDSAGIRYLDAMSGGSMALTLGHGRRDIVEAAREQATRLACVNNQRLTNPPQERLARELVSVAPQGFGRESRLRATNRKPVGRVSRGTTFSAGSR